MTLRLLPEGFCLKPGCCLAMSSRKWRENENLTNYSVLGAVVYFLRRYILKAVSWVPRPSLHPLSIGSLRFLKKTAADLLQRSQREITSFSAKYLFSFLIFSQIRWQKPLQILFQLIEIDEGYQIKFLTFFYPGVSVR